MVSAQTRPARPLQTPLGDLAAWLRGASYDVTASGDLETVVSGLTLSSQRSFPGDLYAALPGSQTHGMTFAADALAAGAVALLTDPAGAADAPHGVPLLVVAEPRRLLGRLAARVYGDPAASMRMIGVTGTQGKTTTTRLVEGGLERAGIRAGVIGTVGHPHRGGGREDLAHHPGGARPARAVRGDARARGRGLRDGGEQPRAGDGPRRRRRLRRRGLPQPRPRPPRLPRRRGGLLPGQGRPLHPRAGPVGADQPRRRSRPPTGQRDDAPGPDLCDAGHRWLGRERCRPRAGRHHVPGPRPRSGSRAGRGPPSRHFQRLQRPRGGGCCGRGRLRPGAGRCGYRRGRGSPGPVRADRRGPAVHGRRRLRAQAGRGRGRPARACDRSRKAG